MRLTYPADLPITARKDDIIRVLREHQVLVLAGETGSGKTTQIPKMCLEALTSPLPHNHNPTLNLLPLIGVTQPRRVAALSIARRLAQELDVQYGREVGSKIRFNDQTSRETRIKVMTDGILLAEAQSDLDLRQYHCIIIDEAHERSLSIDFLLGHLKLLLPRRPELKLVITSATIETEAFSRAFNNAPIIEVSGRTYPVEVLYRPFDHLAEELGDLTYIDAAVYAVEEIVAVHPPGDILIFMPTEKDIRETSDMLEGRFSKSHETVSLFGRLSSAEQERVFSPGPAPRIVIATNIAETSLTIPRIHYVVDSGLARISRYSPRTRTKRLPIEPISQSSANQRKGRCGRLAQGVCIRLYSEEEFQSRPPYTQPEIQRANLAEVILRMKAFHLGDPETFPFLNPPQPNAINAGYQLLHELGALDAKQALTPLGWDLARLPVDPAIGRMIIQAIVEERSPAEVGQAPRLSSPAPRRTNANVLSEVLVIAAGLSIQDPRERPMDQKEAAEQAHRRFADPQSDFLTLLRIWNAYHDEMERLKTQNQMRKFCRAHFLSYMRMREWSDVHAQLEEALENVDFTSIGETITTFKAPPRPDPNKVIDQFLYDGIHRSILSGLLTHIAERRERNLYWATGNREVMIFPGSNLYSKDADKNPLSPRGERARVRGGTAPTPKTFQPQWLVAGEIVQTSRLFARTVAAIQPPWIVELGAHICKFVYEEPHWSPEQGRVLVREKVMLGGLQILSRFVDYAKINPKEATEIFIRAALIEEPVQSPHRFLQHNQELRQKIESWQTRSRSTALPDIDEALFRFYKARIHGVSSIHDLNRFVKEQGQGVGNSLFATEKDLIGDRELKLDTGAFPESIQVAGRAVPLRYAYAPGEEHDGITLQVPVTLMQHLNPGFLEWAIPGWREEQIRTLLRALPKSLRVPLMPLEPKVAEIISELNQGWGEAPAELFGASKLARQEPRATKAVQRLIEALANVLQQKYKVPVTPQSWPADALPDFLKPRVEVTGAENKTLAASRDLQALQTKLRDAEKKMETDVWEQAATKFERYHLSSWDFGDQPGQIELPSSSGVPLLAYPGLQVEDSEVSLRLFRNRQEAILASQQGISSLAEIALERELAWLQKDLRALNSVKDLYITLGTPDELLGSAYANVRNFLFDHAPIYPLRRTEFEAVVATAKDRLQGYLPRLIELVKQVLSSRQQLVLAKKQYPGMAADLNALVPAGFPQSTPWPRLQNFPRYLRSMQIRAERAVVNHVKDHEKSRQVVPYTQLLGKLRARKDLTPEQSAALDDFRWLIEELKVSIFSQELGTAIPISPARLNKILECGPLAPLLKSPA